MGLMCSSEGGRGRRDGGGGNSDQEGNWDLGFMMGVSATLALRKSRIALKCHVSCLGVHVFVFTPCTSRISTRWGATVRRIFQHLEVLLSGALYEELHGPVLLSRGPFTPVFQLTTVQSYSR